MEHSESDISTNNNSNNKVININNNTTIVSQKKSRSVFVRIHNHWNAESVLDLSLPTSKRLQSCRELTDPIRERIEARLKYYSEEEICKTITNHRICLADDKYKLTYRWSLYLFLTAENLSKFLADPQSKYLKDEFKGSIKNLEDEDAQRKANQEEAERRAGWRE